MSALDDALAEAEQLDRIEKEFAEYAAKVNEEWAERWPDYCKARGGIPTAPAARLNISSTPAMRCRPRSAIDAVRSASTPTIAARGNAGTAAGTLTMGCW
jgi:hypothetical protein